MMLHNLPRQSTPFVGRELEIAEITALLNQPDCRLLSLIGPGGMGKTRLSLEIAQQQLDTFADGVFYVALQPLVSADSIVFATASALDFESSRDDNNLQEQLLDYLQNKNILLLMDNFEHVLEGTEFVAQILTSAPQVKILVTSREALKLQQEWVRSVTGMLFPDHERIHEIDSYSAIKLFIDRAEQLRSRFVLEDELPHIIRICQLVGGMPLAIELAAAWLKTISCAEIVAEIQQNVDLLTSQMRDIPERHQSIRVVFDSTWQMLTAEEQAVFIHLSVFRGAPTRQAIQSITGASLLALSGLADKTLLTPAEGGRYQIHELLRQYAYEKLQESDERDAIQDAHCQYYLRFLHERELDIQGRRQIDALEEITLDFENIRSAWSWAVEQMNYDGIRIAVETLCSYLHIRSRWIPDSSIVTQAQNRFAPRDGEKPHPVWAMIIARNYLNNDDPVLALEQALVVAREQNDKGEIGLYLFLMGTAYAYQYNPIESSRYHLAAIPYFEELRDYYHLALAYGLVGTNYRLIGDYESSTEYNEKSLNLRRMIGDIDGQAFATAELSNTMFIIGNLEEAERYRREAILLAQQTGRGGHIAWQQWELAIYHSFGVNGDLREARHSVEDAQNALAGLPKIYKGRGNIVFSHSLIASMDEDYDTARKYGEEALRFNENDAWAPLYRWGLLTAACGQEDYDTVREHTYDLLSRFWELRVVPLLLLGVSFSAILAAYQDKNPQRATELLALASTHRSSMSGWLRVWRLIERLQHHLENELGVDAYEAAWERGKRLEWEYVVARLIADYENKMSLNVGQLEIPPYIVEANAKLVEPLSERELEVLIKVSEGHSNQEIAEQLFVGVSTVKKHITHIYSKLGVESRTQALLWAQELKMN